jgi:hypothetical protein
LDDNARIDACGVAVPEFKVDVGNGIAGVDIDDLVVQDEWNTILAIGDI